MKRRKPINKIGKKSAAWTKARKEIKREFENLGVRSCELGFEGCQRTLFLGFAHSRRRRFITDEKGLREVCLACQRCHETLDRMKHEETERIVLEIIDRRNYVIYN